jgi:hypothetical protein
MKAMELPISTLVVIVIAIIIFLALIAIFSGTFTPANKGFDLESATRATCQKASVYCNYTQSNGYAVARAPVDGFDANKDGKLSHQYDATDKQLSSYCVDDNLETLCGFYYGCQTINPSTGKGCQEGGSTVPGNPSGPNLQSPEDWQSWWQCCMLRVCGC